MPSWLGIDLGTSAVRACLIDEDENLLAIVRRPLDIQHPAVWQESTLACLRTLFQQHPAAEVQSVAVDGTSGTLLLCNQQGKPLTDALMYSDAGSTGQLGVPAPLPTCITGLSGAAQLARQIPGQRAIIQHQTDWISGWLGDQYGFSDDNNALKTGYDPQARQWPDRVIRSLPDSITLPKVMTPGSTIAGAGKILQSIGVPATATIVAGTTDSTATFLATGVNRLDYGVTILGSTLVVKQLSRTRAVDMSRGIYSHRLGDIWLIGGASNTGGKVLTDCFSQTQIETLSLQMNTLRYTGLDYYPLPSKGERFPVNDPNLQPRLQPRPAADSDFLQGIFEGIAQIEADGYRALKSLHAAPVQRVVTGGGGAVNLAWSRIRARTLGVPVIKAEHTQAAYGAARLAKNGAHLFDSYLK